MSELREKVGLLFCKNDRDCMGFKYCNPGCQTKADAAIALALEEAAVVIENDCHDDMTRAEEAAAIRALKDKP